MFFTLKGVKKTIASLRYEKIVYISPLVSPTSSGMEALGQVITFRQRPIRYSGFSKTHLKRCSVHLMALNVQLHK